MFFGFGLGQFLIARSQKEVINFPIIRTQNRTIWPILFSLFFGLGLLFWGFGMELQSCWPGDSELPRPNEHMPYIMSKKTDDLRNVLIRIAYSSSQMEGGMAHEWPHTTKLSKQAHGPLGEAVSARAPREGRQSHAAICGRGMAGCSFKIVDGAVCVVECC